MRLSKSVIDRLPLPVKKDNKATQMFYRDSALPDFGLRIGSGGTKTFFVEKRVNGKNKRITIGSYGALTPEQARREAQRLLSEIALGIDPEEHRKIEQVRTITLLEAYEDYCADRKDLRASTRKDYDRHIQGSFKDWQSKRLIDIKKDMVSKKHRVLGVVVPM